jgi:hypothetical protein
MSDGQLNDNSPGAAVNSTLSASKLTIARLAIVIISTFAVGINSVTRVQLLREIMQTLQQETIHGKPSPAPMTDAGSVSSSDQELTDVSVASSANNELDSKQHVLEPVSKPVSETSKRLTVASLKRQIYRSLIDLLSLLLNTIPFFILNILTLVEMRQSSNSALVAFSTAWALATTAAVNGDIAVYPTSPQLPLLSMHAVSLLVALLFSCVLLGNKIQSFRALPALKVELLRAQLQLVQVRQQLLISSASSVSATI